MRPSRPPRPTSPRRERRFSTRSVSHIYASFPTKNWFDFRLRSIGNVVLGANTKYESIASNELATQAFSVVKDHVSNFVQNSKILMGALDEVAKAHPFVQGTRTSHL